MMQDKSSNQFEKSPQQRQQRNSRPSPKNRKDEPKLSFFDPLIERSLEFTKPSPDILKIWDSVCESPDAYALMLVKTSTSANLRAAFPSSYANQNFLGAALAAGANLAQGAGGSTQNLSVGAAMLADRRKSLYAGASSPNGKGSNTTTAPQTTNALLYCVLCSEHMFLFIPPENGDPYEMDGETLVQNAPDFYLNVEFSKLTVIKTEENGYPIKQGFTLSLRERQHDFIIQLPPPQPELLPSQTPDALNINNNTGPTTPNNTNQLNVAGKPISIKENLLLRNQISHVDHVNPILKVAGAGGATGKDVRRSSVQVGQISSRAQALKQKSQISILGGGANGNKAMEIALESFENPIQFQFHKGGAAATTGGPIDVKAELKLIYRQWMCCLNESVVRSENLKKYNVVEQIGIGGQARVYKIMGKNPSFYPPHLLDELKQSDSFNRTYAIKIISKKKFDTMDKSERYQMLDEIRIMRNLKNCANTIKLLKIYESDSYLNLLMEFQEGGTLGDRLEKNAKFTEEESRMIAAQLLLTIDFMSIKGIIHRDLKPENILLNSRKDGIYDLRVADYGFACMFDVNNPNFEYTGDKYVCGTAGYISPEAFEGKGYSPKSDVFSIGSILFSLLTSKNLFAGRDYNQIMENNKQCTLNDLTYKMRNLQQDAKDLLPQMIAKDPSKRITAKQALLHPWFQTEHLAVQSSLNLNSLLAKNSNGTVSQLQVLMHSGSIVSHNQTVLHSLSIHTKNNHLSLRNQLHLQMKTKGTQECEQNQNGQTLRPQNRQISLAGFKPGMIVTGTLLAQRMQSIQPALNNQSSINPALHNQNSLNSNFQGKNLPAFQNMQSLNPALQNMQSLNPALQHLQSLNPNVPNLSQNPAFVYQNSLNPVLQNMNSLNPPQHSKRSDTLSSHRSYLPIRRDPTMDSAYGRNISQRSEIIQQFNYYKILSDYKKNKFSNPHSNVQGSPPGFGGNRQQYSQFLELPTAKGGGRASSAGNQAAAAAAAAHQGGQPNALAQPNGNQSFHQMVMEQQQNLLFCVSESNIAQHAPFIPQHSQNERDSSGMRFSSNHLIDSSKQHLELFNNSKIDQSLAQDEEEKQRLQLDTQQAHSKLEPPGLARLAPVQQKRRNSKVKVTDVSKAVKETAEAVAGEAKAEEAFRRQNLHAAGNSKISGQKKKRRPSNVSRSRPVLTPSGKQINNIKELAPVTPKTPPPPIQIQAFNHTLNKEPSLTVQGEGKDAVAVASLHYEHCEVRSQRPANMDSANAISVGAIQIINLSEEPGQVGNYDSSNGRGDSPESDEMLPTDEFEEGTSKMTARLRKSGKTYYVSQAQQLMVKSKRFMNNLNIRRERRNFV